MHTLMKSFLATLMLIGFSSTTLAEKDYMVEVRCAENNVELHRAFTKLKQHIDYLYTQYSPAILDGLDRDMEFIATEAMWQLRPKSELIPGLHMCKDNQVLYDSARTIAKKAVKMKSFLSISAYKALRAFSRKIIMAMV